MSASLENLRKFVALEIIFGNGSRHLAGEYCKKLFTQKPMIVTDKGVSDAGWTADVADSLAAGTGPDIVPAICQDAGPGSALWTNASPASWAWGSGLSRKVTIPSAATGSWRKTSLTSSGCWTWI